MPRELYDYIQVNFAFNSNRMEGIPVTMDQVKRIYEGAAGTTTDIVNHFRCFDYILDTYAQDLTEEYIKELHRILKTGTISSESEEAVVGDYKKYRNAVGDLETTEPDKVPEAMRDLIGNYAPQDLMDIICFHVDLESIHPFYDGNGRVGRLIMFKECLRLNILPFIILERDKYWYSLGLKEWQIEGKDRRLIETIRLMQDEMEAVFDYFEINKPWRGEGQDC